MFAVFKAGNSQYKVHENDELKIEKIDGDSGTEVHFDQILVIGSDKKTCIIGTPFVKGAAIKAEIIAQTRDKKILVFKKQRRQNYRRKNGHRQEITHIKIKQIVTN